MKGICAEPFINLFKLCADIRVVFWSPRNLEKSVGANNENGNECNSFLTPCLYLQNTVNVENCNICGFLNIHIILNEKSFITLLSLAQFMKSWYLWKSNIMNIIFNFPESSRVHGNFWGLFIYLFFCCWPKRPKKRFSDMEPVLFFLCWWNVKGSVCILLSYLCGLDLKWKCDSKMWKFWKGMVTWSSVSNLCEVFLLLLLPLMCSKDQGSK